MNVDGDSHTSDPEQTPMAYTYGLDIWLRPFANAPNWKISLGTALQQVEANSDDGSDTDNTMIMLGFVYEWGSTYSDVVFGPVTQ